MKANTAAILIAVAQIWSASSSYGDSPKMAGPWTVEIMFGTGDTRSLRFDAKDAGKGSFLLLDRISQTWNGRPMEAKWSQTEDSFVMFSGPIEFPVGNVGVDAGTLEFKGKMSGEGSIKGEVTFSPNGDGPSKHGTFTAVPVRAK